jgi:hypothetical protein
VAIEGGPFTVRLTGSELLPNALLAFTVKLKTPAGVGVPLTVEAFRVSPAGSAPLVTDQVIGVVPAALSLCE